MVLSRYDHGQLNIKLSKKEYNRILATQDNKEPTNKNLMWYVWHMKRILLYIKTYFFVISYITLEVYGLGTQS